MNGCQSVQRPPVGFCAAAKELKAINSTKNLFISSSRIQLFRIAGNFKMERAEPGFRRLEFQDRTGSPCERFWSILWRRTAAAVPCGDRPSDKCWSVAP